MKLNISIVIATFEQGTGPDQNFKSKFTFTDILT